MTTAINRADDVLSFGPFNLRANERFLTKEGAPVDLGSRALDILIVLTSSPNEIVSKKTLMSQVWPDVIVEEGSLRFHMNGLRKALGDGKDGARYITTLPGRGYCFVAPISRPSDRGKVSVAVAANVPHANLPGRLLRMVGRDDDVRRLSAQLIASRFVTIVGAGGVGKTTVAVAVAHHLQETFTGSILFVDLGTLSDPKLAATTVASMLELSVQSDDATPGLIAFLKDKRILLILDTCEHLVDAIAALATSIIETAPQVHLLATSREALRVKGEHAYRLDSLVCPPDAPGLTAKVVQTFPAAQLFLERAVASGGHAVIRDEEAPIVASICRKLDGVALAIELTARRVETYGLQQTAALLDQRLTLLWLGSRTAPPRQKTLQATLDWSYALLSEVERTVLRRLAAFVGYFTLDAALAVVNNGNLDQSLILGAIDNLVAKSMVAPSPIGTMMRYRLLDTTRAYALGISIDDAEAAGLATRHATYYRQLLEQNATEWSTFWPEKERAVYFAHLSNVRAALEWSFGIDGNAKIGVGLAAAAAPVFLAISLFTECVRWSERAILALDDTTRGSPEETHWQTTLRTQIKFQVALANALMHVKGYAAPETKAAVERARVLIEQADGLGEPPEDPLLLFSILYGFWAMNFVAFNGDAMRELATQFLVLAQRQRATFPLMLGHRLTAASLLFTGNISQSRAHYDQAIAAYNPDEHRPLATRFGQDLGVTILSHRSWALWLLGYPESGLRDTHDALKNARETGQAAALMYALLCATWTRIYCGDYAAANAAVDELVALADEKDASLWRAWGLTTRGWLLALAGKAADAAQMIASGIAALRSTGTTLWAPLLLSYLARSHAELGQFDDASRCIAEAMTVVERAKESWCEAEVHRIAGEIALMLPTPDEAKAEANFEHALATARMQHAKSWELRAAMSMARLWRDQGKRQQARDLLAPVCGWFTEGFSTADLQMAESLLRELRGG
jgi:predicted ATPase/DNA-binding winged helix-turn-helix (wHTH) protein